jgi:hypothetical protein
LHAIPISRDASKNGVSSGQLMWRSISALAMRSYLEIPVTLMIAQLANTEDVEIVLGEAECTAVMNKKQAHENPSEQQRGFRRLRFWFAEFGEDRFDMPSTSLQPNRSPMLFSISP